MTIKPSISLSISVVCYNSPPDEVKQLLESLLNAILYLGQSQTLSVTPIYLVDNSDQTPLSLDIFAEFGALCTELKVDLRHLYGQGNVGYGRAHNLVLEKLDSDYHLILNPDVVLEEAALLEAISFINYKRGIVMLSPNAKDSLGAKQYLCKRYPSVFTLLVRGFFPEFLRSLFRKRLARYEMHELDEKEVSEDIPLVSGCFMFVRTEALKEVGGFDEFYFLYFEDFDLSIRIGKLGKIAYAPNVRIVHHGGNAAKKGFRHLKMFIQSGIRFFNKHGWQLFKQS